MWEKCIYNILLFKGSRHAGRNADVYRLVIAHAAAQYYAAFITIYLVSVFNQAWLGGRKKLELGR
jgi:hypothetical protein